MLIMSKRQIVRVVPERKIFEGRWNKVRIRATGEVFHVGVLRGRPVRIPYKPRGHNIGFKWHCRINDERGREIASFECDKSLGPESALRWAGLLLVVDFRQRSLDWFRREIAS